MHEGMQEKLQKQQLGIEQQRATSDVALQGAQTEEIRERIRRQKVLQDMFAPKPDFGAAATPPVSTDTSGAPTVPGATAAPPQLRSDFDRIVDQSELPDELKSSVKLNGRMQVQAGQPVKAFDFFQSVLDKFGRKVTPHILSNGGIPYAVTDRFGEPWELHDPNMPDEMKPLADAARKVYEQKNILMPADVQNANAANSRLFGVVNPGQPLPADLTLPPNATKDEAARVDKHMKDLLQAQSIKTQRDAANAARDASLTDRQEKEGMKWVSWTDDDGRTVAGSLSQAKQMGAKNPAEVPTEEIRNITDARGAVRLINKQGDPQAPETMGVLQLANTLDKEGKMGVFASRFNNFLTKGIGAAPDDDPRIVTLLDKSQLLMTLAMKAHFGASGGRSPQMLEHFVDMANAGKMDGSTFIAGAKAVGNYMEDRAMLPKTSAAPAATPKAGGFSPDNPFAPKKGPQ